MKKGYFFAVGVLLVLTVSYAGHRYYDLEKELTAAREEFASTTATLQYENNDLSQKLTASDLQNTDLKTLLGARVQESQAMNTQVASLTATVSTLDQLAKIDKQLLEKYSSVYFLNENYAPANLTQIDAQYLNRPDRPEQFLTGAYAHLTALLNAAHQDHIALQILSAYRSSGTQSTLKTSYRVTYGAGTANAFSADQGYSEHQLGTAVDFTTPSTGSILIGFDKSSSYFWLEANAYIYGFILSYPKGNMYFVFEPWHWRYVGVELATKLHDEGKHFYDLDQREIDTYLIKFFD